MATQINSFESKKYKIENSSYIIVKTNNDRLKTEHTQTIMLNEVEKHQIAFEIGEYEHTEIIFIANDVKNDYVEIECYNDLNQSNDDFSSAFHKLKDREKYIISTGVESLVPGEYPIKFYSKNKSVEFLYKINSSNLNQLNLDKIRDAVDNFLYGLSKNNNTSSTIFEKTKLDIALKHLIDNPISDITKDRFGKKIITKDNIENRILKKILNEISRDNNSVASLIKNSWVKNIKPSKYIKPTLRLMKEKNYYKVYNSYTKNMREKSSPYKKTSILFEIYTFITIINLLEEMNFNWVSGWIKDREFDLHDLEKGQVVIFEKDNLKIRVSFDKEIKYIEEIVYKKSSKKFENQMSQVCATNDITCRKPDVLIELFKDDMFISSMIVEAKYRNQRNIDSMINVIPRQLRCYRKFDFYDDYKKKILNVKTINKVVIFYPKQEKEKLDHNIYSDITFIPSDISSKESELKFEILTFLKPEIKDYEIREDIFEKLEYANNI
ncbi:MAG: hypothetical protein R3Y64_07575 [Peptostreptococcaceae bacterium]